MKRVAGVDVSKGSLDVSTLDKSWGVQNNVKGITGLVKAFKQSAIDLVVLESTGGYELGLMQLLWSTGIPVVQLNPRLSKAFSRSLGAQAKTDKIDAAMLRLYGERNDPRPTPAPAQGVLELRALLARRGQLMEMIIAEKNRLKSAFSTPTVSRQIRSHINVLQKQVASIDQGAERIIKSTSNLSDRAAVISKQKGIGAVVAHALLADMPELGTLNRKQAAALVGVAPYNCQSGAVDGKRSTAGGRKRLRSILYMATLTAIRYDSDLKAFYLRLVKAGKHKKVALVAAMRRFLVTINGELRNHFASENAKILSYQHTSLAA